MRRRTDANQKDIMDDLRACGCTVASLSNVGKGVPDLLVGVSGKNYLLEIKNPKGRGTAKTPDQKDWHEEWRGSVFTVTTTEEALKAMGVWHRGRV